MTKQIQLPVTAVKYYLLSELNNWKDNYHQGDVVAIRNSILEFGFNRPLGIWKDDTTVTGNHALKALKELQESGNTYNAKSWPPKNILIAEDGIDWLIPGIDVSHLNWNKAQAFAIADNRSAQKGYDDEKLLSGLLVEIAANNKSWLPAVGYSQDEIDKMLHEATRNSEVSQSESRGTKPEEALEGFNNATIKQIVLYFSGPEYDAVLDRLKTVMNSEELESHTDVFLRLLELYEENTGK